MKTRHLSALACSLILTSGCSNDEPVAPTNTQQASPSTTARDIEREIYSTVDEVQEAARAKLDAAREIAEARAEAERLEAEAAAAAASAERARAEQAMRDKLADLAAQQEEAARRNPDKRALRVGEDQN